MTLVIARHGAPSIHTAGADSKDDLVHGRELTLFDLGLPSASYLVTGVHTVRLISGRAHSLFNCL